MPKNKGISALVLSKMGFSRRAICQNGKEGDQMKTKGNRLRNVCLRLALCCLLIAGTVPVTARAEETTTGEETTTVKPEEETTTAEPEGETTTEEETTTVKPEDETTKTEETTKEEETTEGETTTAEEETTEAEVVLSVSTDRKNVRPGDKITLTVSVDQFRSRRSDDTDREFGLLVIPGKVVNVFECHVSLDQATVIEDSIQPLVYEPSYAQLDNTVGVSEVTPSVKNHINYIEETDSPVALFTLQVIAPEGIAENQILHFDFVDTVIAKNMNAEETYTVKTVGAEVRVCAEEIFVNDGDMTLEVDEDTDVLKGIRAGMTAEQLGNSCNYTVEVYQGTEGEAAESSAVIRTGDIVKLFDAEGREVYSYTACVKGDVSGDGKIDVLDMEKIQKSILNLQVLDGVYEQAGMLTEGSTRLSVMDMEVIQKNILGIEKI